MSAEADGSAEILDLDFDNLMVRVDNVSVISKIFSTEIVSWLTSSTACNFSRFWYMTLAGTLYCLNNEKFEGWSEKSSFLNLISRLRIGCSPTALKDCLPFAHN